MKTMLKVTLVIAFAAFANTVFASGNLKVNLLPIAGEKAVVAISTLSTSNFSITVTDENDQIVYFNETTEPLENYRKVYNFSDLDDGSYKLTVLCDDLTSERQFHKKHGVITVGNEKTTIKPFFGYEDGIFKCTYLNFPKENLTLYLYDGKQLLYTKTIGRNFVVNEALNLSKLENGTYVATLSAGGKEYYYNLDLK